MSNENISFTGTYINNTKAGSLNGAAVYICRQTEEVDGIFIGNNTSAMNGGAIGILSGNEVNKISGYFLNNYASKAGKSGGAIANFGTVNYITADFIANTSTAYGGAISNSSVANNIIGDFIRNSSQNGGAIYNSNSIGNIVGDFTDNIATQYGGAIYNNGKDVSIQNIYGNFINNSGSAIYNYNGAKITSINGNFYKNPNSAIHNNAQGAWIGKIEGNFVENEQGAVSNTAGTIDEISGTFVNNRAGSSTAGVAGAITNAYAIIFGGSGDSSTSKIGKITGKFIGNNVYRPGSYASGGAVTNSGVIDLISAEFEENYAYGAGAQGGAISSGTALKIVNSKFKDNYAKSDTGSKSYGGAIYLSDNLYLESTDKYDFTFDGNYVEANDGTKDYQAIYLSRHSESGVYSASTLTMNALKDAKFTVKDGIEGYDGYANLLIKSDDGTGQFDFYNYIKGFDTTVQNSVVNLLYSDKEITDYTQKSINTSTGTVNFTLDLKASDGTTDTITTTSTSSGTINITDINFIDSASAGSTETYQILNTNEGLELALSKTKYVTGETSRIIPAVILADIDVVSSDQIKSKIQSGEIYNQVALATKNTTNDSISVTYGLTDYNGTPVDSDVSQGDTLNLWNTATVAETVKNFNFTLENQTYTSVADAGISTADTVNINGYSDGKSVLDFNNYAGFTLSNATVLNLNDVKLTGNTDLITISNSDADVNLKNAILDGNISSSVNYDLNISGNSTINGTVDKANATLTGADSILTIGSATLANASLTADEGTLDFINSAIDTVTIGKLTNTSTSGVNINIDVDASAKTADKLVLSNLSSGTVNINNINWLSELSTTTPAGTDWKVQVLSQPEGSTIKLALSDILKSNEYLIEKTTRTDTYSVKDTIAPIINSTDKFYQNDYQDVIEVFNLGKLTTDGNYITLEQTSSSDGNIISSELTGTKELNSLKELSQLNTTSNREFNFVSANETYTINENLGDVSDGQFSINGKVEDDLRSVIDMNANQGFSISKDVVMNINDMEIINAQGAEARYGSVISAKHGELNINNSVFDNNISSQGGGVIFLTDGTREIVFGGSAASAPGSKMSITDSVFRNNKASSGGAMFIEGADITEISGSFINNSVTSATGFGGAIYQYYGYSENPNIIRTIKADFEGNKAYYGGAITSTQTIDKIIDSTFNGNISTAWGGAIYHQGLINTIQNTTFEENSATQFGGAMACTAPTGGSSLVGTITDTNFINNKANQYGGAIFTFTGAEIKTLKDTTFTGNNGVEAGGAVFVYTNSKIDTIENTTFTGNYSKAGGAIYNQGTIGNIVNSDFYDNYATNSNGGAIYTTKDLKITADNGTSTFRGNYYQASATSAKSYRAIYEATAGNEITLNAVNNGTITFYDGIFGVTGYKVHLTGDNTGTINFINGYTQDGVNIRTAAVLNNANVKLDGGVTANLKYSDYGVGNYAFNSFDIQKGTMNLAVDVDADSGKSDTITTVATSNGTITINDLNIINSGIVGYGGSKTFKILNTNEGLGLALGKTKYIADEVEAYLADVVTADVDVVSNSQFRNYSQAGELYHEVELATTTTTNDSIKITYNLLDFNGEITDAGSMGDTLALWSTATVAETIKNFNFTSENQTYTSVDDAGVLTAGTVNINGYSDGKSVLDLNGNNGFELDNETTLNLNDVKLTGNTDLITVSNSDADVNLKNATLDGSISSAINYDLNVSGNSTIKGNVDNADVTLTGTDSIFSIGSATLKNASLTADEGTLNLADNSVNTTYIDTLTTTSASGLTLNIDINAADTSNVTADILNLGSASNGTVTLGSVNFVNEVAPGSVFEVSVIDTTSSDVKLSIADSVSGSKYSNIGTNTADFIAYNGVITDELPAVNDTVNSNDLYEIWNKTGSLYGSINLSSTNPFGIELKVDGTDWDESSKKLVKKIDVLAALIQKETTNDRNFNFATEDETYTVTENLGSATSGTININGYSDGKSVIDLDGNSGFVLDNETTLNLNDVKLTGNDDLITVNNTNAEVNLNNVNLDGNIVSSNTYDLGIKGNTKLKGSVGDATVTVNSGSELTLLSNDHFKNADVTLNNGVTLNLINDSAQTQLARSYSVVGDIIMNIDADLAKGSVDRLPSGTAVASTATINLNRINLLSDSVNPITKIPFAESSYSDNVKYTGPGVLTKSTQLGSVLAPIFKYGISYDPTNGSLIFSRAGNNPSYNDVNPEIMAGAVASELGGYVSLVNTYDEAFRNMNYYMFLPKQERMAIKNANKYASLGDTPYQENYQYHNKAIWSRPYSIFEKVKLKNGPDVSNVLYGSFFGLDSELIEAKNGWDVMWGIYGSYNGSHQAFDGISIYQNGGIFGVTGMAYKDNFYTGVTVAAGASIADASTMYGQDDFTMMLAGIASRSGYNFEFADGKLILQPNFLISYSFVNTFDFTNAAGVRIKSDPLHAIQLEPGLRIIGNCKNGLQPYASASFIYNILDNTKVKANDISLPNIAVEPYVKYGVGVKKTWVERLSCFLQTYLTQGGRDGVGIQLGIRWNF